MRNQWQWLPDNVLWDIFTFCNDESMWKTGIAFREKKSLQEFLDIKVRRRLHIQRSLQALRFLGSERITFTVNNRYFHYASWHTSFCRVFIEKLKKWIIKALQNQSSIELCLPKKLERKLLLLVHQECKYLTWKKIVPRKVVFKFSYHE